MLQRHIESAIEQAMSDTPVVLLNGAICGVEVKASATVGPSDFSALKALQEQLPNRFRTGVVLYSGDQIVPYGDHLWLMPVHALWTC